MSLVSLAKQSAEKSAASPTPSRAAPSGRRATPSLTLSRYAQLQASVGNQAVLRSNAPGVACGANRAITPANGALEREADAAAARALAGLAPTLQTPGAADRGVHRKCTACTDEEPVQRWATDGGHELLSSAGVESFLAADIGQPLAQRLREDFEPRFGYDFSAVRVHTGRAASVSARSIKALAYTTGSHMVFRDGAYAPETTAGRQLLAHELAHVVQQRSKIQRKQEPGDRWVPGGGAEPIPGEGLDVIFVVDDPVFVADIVKYVQAVFPDSDSQQSVTSLEELFDALDLIGKHDRIKRLRLVTHGWVPKEHPTEGWVKFNDEKGGHHWVTPKAVTRFARSQKTRRIIERVMAPGAVVEFWGCNIGRSESAGQAWANLFQSTFAATTETFRTGFLRFSVPRKKGLRGAPDPNRPGWVYAQHSGQVPPEHQQEFEEFLLRTYAELVLNKDIQPVAEANRVAYMKELFDRSFGDIRYLQITKKDDRDAKHPIRPSQQKEWGELWRSWSGRAEALPTDIPVREPDAASLEQLFANSPKPKAPPRATQSGRARQAVDCDVTDSSPSGPFQGVVAFGPGSADVVGAGADALSRFALSVGGPSAPVRVRVDGYASMDGSDAYNLDLSCRRAQAVKDALLQRHRFPASQIQTHAHGETSEFARANLASNRVVVVSATPVRAAAVPQVASPTNSAERTPKALEKRAHEGPHLLSTGLAAALAVQKHMPSAQPITVSSALGWVRLVPGTVWDNDKMLVWPTEMVVFYTEGPNLYEVPTWLFLRTFYLDAFARGVRRAEHWEAIAKVELALLEGAFVPVWAIVIATLGGAALKYVHHKQQIDPALRQVPHIIRLLGELHKREPALFDLLLRSFLRELLEVVKNLPRGIRAEDIAFFLGRLFHKDWMPSPVSWFKGGPEPPMWMVEHTIGSLRHVLWVTLAVMVTHSPGMAVNLAKQSVEHTLDEWRAAMKREGISVTREEARVLYDELRAHPEAEQRLRVLEAALREFLPAVKLLAEVLASK